MTNIVNFKWIRQSFFMKKYKLNIDFKILTYISKIFISTYLYK